MIINTDHNVFDEIYWLLFTSRKNENHTRSFSCTIMSAIVASYMLQFKEELFIIDSQNHSVIFDGTSTWDLALGIVFENYKYPNLDIPWQQKRNQQNLQTLNFTQELKQKLKENLQYILQLTQMVG